MRTPFFIFRLRFIIFYLPAFVLCFFPWVSDAAQTMDRIPPSTRSALTRAYALFDKGEIQAAIDLLKAHKKEPSKQSPDVPDTSKTPRHYLIDFTLGNGYLKLGHLSDAVSHYEAAVSAEPDFAPAWLNLGKCYYDLRDFEEAGKCFEKGYQTAQEKDPASLYYSAVSFMAAGQYDRAIEIFERLFADHRPKVKLSWKQSLAQLYLLADQPKKALPYLEEIAIETTDEEKIRWQEILLHQYLALEMTFEAERYAKERLHNDPIESVWWKALAHVYLVQNHYDEALVPLTVYGFLNPLSEDEETLLADLNLKIGIPEEAAHRYEKILSGGKKPSLIRRLAQAYLSLDQADKALEILRRRSTQDDPELLMLLGEILFDLERYREAMAAFEDSAKRLSNPGRAWLMTGYAAWRLHDLKRANHAFEKAKKDEKHKKAAVEALRRINKTF